MDGLFHNSRLSDWTPMFLFRVTNPRAQNKQKSWTKMERKATLNIRKKKLKNLERCWPFCTFLPADGNPTLPVTEPKSLLKNKKTSLKNLSPGWPLLYFHPSEDGLMFTVTEPHIQNKQKSLTKTRKKTNLKILALGWPFRVSLSSDGNPTFP